jgi:uncharacterized repeat protein (TIGR03803 family)
MYGMKTSLSFFFLFAFALFAFAALMCASAAGQNNFKVIHSFSGYPNDGMSPVSSVVFDKAGNMYGSTPGGGNQTGCGDLGCGVVYELSPDGQGSWTETILYDFCHDFDGASCLDGAYPDNITMDAGGNLYGTTFSGGSGHVYGAGSGVAFELSPPKEQGGPWTETVLYNFCSDFNNGSCLDGWVGFEPPLALDAAGNLYGAAALGGTGHVAGGEGLVFELSRSGDGWKETVLHNFCTRGQGDSCPDGYEPSGVALDHHGNLYGTTAYSGNVNSFVGGTLFELVPSGGRWKYQSVANIPANFQPFQPEAPVTFDAAGNLYGTLSAIYGGVFRIDAKSRKLSLLSFNDSDGVGPNTLYIDSRRHAIYGTAVGGGAYQSGTLYSVNEGGHLSVLYNFCQLEECADGDGPSALAPDAVGDLFGAAEFGGTYGLGVIFQYAP